MIEVSFWAILAAGIASVLIGWVWYHPSVFGTAWMRMSNITPEMAERGRKRMPLVAILGLCASMVIAYVMTYFGMAWGVFDVISAIELGLWSWIGFVAPTMLGSVLWEQKPMRLYIINAAYWLIALIVMAIILVVGSQALSSGGQYSLESDTAIVGE